MGRQVGYPPPPAVDGERLAPSSGPSTARIEIAVGAKAAVDRGAIEIRGERRIAEDRLDQLDHSVQLVTIVRVEVRDGSHRWSVYARRMVDPDARSATPWRALLLALGAFSAVVAVLLAWSLASPRATPTNDPPVLAGQPLWGSCAAGFYARLGGTVVLTSSAHCASEGTTAIDPDGRTVRGVFGPAATLEPCEHREHSCRPSDMNYLVVAPDRIPWGRLNVVDMGDGGVRTIEPGTAPLSCSEIRIGDAVEINGRARFRAGNVAEKGEYLHELSEDGDYFPCMVAAADIDVGVGDSGGAVLVRGLPAGVASRSFGGKLGFTPLAEGMDALGLELCTTPNCGLAPP
jgi:hypothetical protein